MKSIGHKVKELRENSGLTQKNTADYLQVDQSLISMIEAGKRSMTSDMLDKLATLFGVPMSAFEDDSSIQPLSFALRASEINIEDLKTISDINRIALNCDFMTQLIKGGCPNG